MHIDIAEWLNLAIRWLHLTAGIAWIGSSFYFVWLDMHLKPPAQGEASGEVWSVHGGGFYHNQKYQVAPSTMPAELHWFKWEAYFTWISGFSLLVLIYYVGAQNFLIDPAKAALSPAAAIGIGLAAQAFGWLLYDLMCRSPLRSSNMVLGVWWFVILLFAAVALLVFPLAAGNPWLLAADVFAIGASVSLGAVLQTRLMDVAGDAQALAAALNHSAFNTANALGPFLGGLAIREGLGWTSTGPVGAALALLGFLIWIVAAREARAAPVEDASSDAALLKDAPARPAPPLAPDDRSRSDAVRDPVA